MVFEFAHQLSVFQFELTVMIELCLVFLFVSCENVFQGRLMLPMLLPASECFRRESRSPASLLFNPVEQPADVVSCGEPGQSCFQGSQARIGGDDFLVPGCLLIQQRLPGEVSFRFRLASRDQLQLGQSRLLRGEPGETEKWGMEFVHVDERSIRNASSYSPQA